jgi:hypothetical protein
MAIPPRPNSIAPQEQYSMDVKPLGLGLRVDVKVVKREVSG